MGSKAMSDKVESRRLHSAKDRAKLALKAPDNKPPGERDDEREQREIAVFEMIKSNVLARWSDKTLKASLPCTECSYSVHRNYHVLSGIVRHGIHAPFDHQLQYVCHATSSCSMRSRYEERQNSTQDVCRFAVGDIRS
jgi:hypothetical protein